MRIRKRRFRDEISGRVVWQVTDGETMHHHLYFLNPSWTPDGRLLICVSHAEGRPNLVAIDDETGLSEPLTAIDDLTPFSACPARDGRGVFSTAGPELRWVDIASRRQEVVARFTDGLPSSCALNHDGASVVTNVRRGTRNTITVVRADGRGTLPVLDTEREVGHVQFEPTPAGRILSGALRHGDGSRAREDDRCGARTLRGRAPPGDLRCC